MWQAKYEMTTDVTAEQLFRVLMDINHWNRWDNGLEFAKIEGPPKEGANFILKPKGGPNVKMSIEEFQAPVRLVDIAHLPLAKMRTVHEFLQSGDQTTVRFSIQVWGLLGFFWRKVVGEKQIHEAPAQVASFISYARSNS